MGVGGGAAGKVVEKKTAVSVDALLGQWGKESKDKGSKKASKLLLNTASKKGSSKEARKHSKTKRR